MSKNVKETPEKKKAVEGMPLINHNAAGIDIGDTLHVVAVPEGRDNESVKSFGTFTCDLEDIAIWLKQCKIETVAMESTGVYWKPLFAVLIEKGFEVNLVNAKHVKNVTGRKNDEDDARWIQRLHSCALLKTSFLPDALTESLRTLVRFRNGLTKDSSKFILRIQKSLELMNIKVHTVISDMTGKTGTAIIEAILAGKREPESFIEYIDPRIQADPETIMKSLKGNWQREHLITLRESYEFYKFIQQRIIMLEKEIELILQETIAAEHEGEISIESDEKSLKRKRKSKNHPLFDVQAYLNEIHGVDVMEIYGLSATGALEILAETGRDLSKWETEDKFIGWLNLCPNNKISGGKLISSSRLKRKPNSATQAFRAAANSLMRSNHWLGDYFRKMRAKGGQKYAIVATARKLAIIYYKMVRYKTPFNPPDLLEYRKNVQSAKIAYLERTLEKLKSQAA
jgi:transposase